MASHVAQWLEAVVLRHRTRYIIQVALWSVAAVAFGLTISRNASPSLPVVALLLATVMVALGTILLAWRQRASPVLAISSAARRADDRLELKHRLASVLDLERGRDAATGSVLAGALINDAANRISGVEPSSVAPLADRFTWAAALATLLAAAAMVFWHAVPMQPADAPTLAETAVAQTPNVTIEDVQAAAEQIALDSTMRDVDALMRAAHGLKSLLQDAAAGPQQKELNQRFAELLEMARMGYGETPPDWILRKAGSEQSLASRIEDYRAARRQENTQSDNPAAPMTQTASGAEPEATTPRPGSLTAGEDTLSVEAMPGRNVPTLPGTPVGNEVAPSLGAPVGASSQSGAGGGDMAGLGSQEPKASAFSLQDVAGSEMFLPPTETGAGKRIKINTTLPPAMAAAEGSDTTAQRLAEAAMQAVTEVDRDLVLSDDERTTARYFASPVAGEGAAIQ